jgi:general stress protein YciG
MENDSSKKSKRGFATWNKEKLLKVSHRGGIAAHARGVAHEFTREEARIAGRKGGLAAHAAKSSETGSDKGDAPQSAQEE